MGATGLVISAATLGIVFYHASGGYAPSRAAATSKDLPLSPSHFTPVSVTSSKQSDGVGLTRLISLKVPKHLMPPPESTEPIFSVYLKDSDIQVERPYTPLKGINSEGEMHFWVKKYEHGEVGRWFHRRLVGETVEIRGPIKTLEWEDGKWDEVVLVCHSEETGSKFEMSILLPPQISGGTGITPFYQLLHKEFAMKHLNRSDDRIQPRPLRQTHFTLMHASPSTDTLPPPIILDDLRGWALTHPDRLTVKVFVDDKRLSASENIFQTRIDAASIEKVRQERSLVKSASWLDWARGAPQKKNTDKKVLFMVCGPEP